MTRRSLLITGGAGMVGQNLLEHTALSDWTVLAPARSELDLTDRAATEAYVSHHRPDHIVHAAGKVGGIHANLAHPVDFLVDNLDLGINIITAARKAGVPHLLNLGSSCMYPRGHDEPLREEQVLSGELEPTNEGYAIAKIAAARLCTYIQREDRHLHYRTLIPCNLYGRHDKFAPEHSHLVPAIIAKVHHAKVNGLPTIEIWGDGTARREFMYAGDLVDAIVRALDAPDTLPDTMNVGLGYDYTIKQYYEIAARVIGWGGSFEYDTSKPTGMARKLVDTSRQQAWGWQPLTSIEDGLAQTYAFYLEGWT